MAGACPPNQTPCRLSPTARSPYLPQASPALQPAPLRTSPFLASSSTRPPPHACSSPLAHALHAPDPPLVTTPAVQPWRQRLHFTPGCRAPPPLCTRGARRCGPAAGPSWQLRALRSLSRSPPPASSSLWSTSFGGWWVSAGEVAGPCRLCARACGLGAVPQGIVDCACVRHSR